MVSRGDLEEQFATVRALAPGGAEGVFGPASVTRRIDREAAIFLGAGRALSPSDERFPPVGVSVPSLE